MRFHLCSVFPSDDASSAAAVLTQRFMCRSTGGSVNPLALYTEMGKAAALGILGDKGGDSTTFLRLRPCMEQLASQG